MAGRLCSKRTQNVSTGSTSCNGTSVRQPTSPNAEVGTFPKKLRERIEANYAQGFLKDLSLTWVISSIRRARPPS